MNCEEFRAHYLAAEQLDGMPRHLETCAACRGASSELDAERAALADPRLWEEPPAALGVQIAALIAANAGNTGAGWARRVVRPLVAAVAILVVAIGSFALLRTPSPDWTAVINGTHLAATASGTVEGWNEDGGTRMLIRVAGLDPAPDGFVYEFWLSDGPIHISAGTFRSAGEVELWSGVRRSDFPRLWVTLEPIDEEESPSEATVLDTDA